MGPYSPGSRMTGSIIFVLRSTARTIVRCWPRRRCGHQRQDVTAVGQAEADGEAAVGPQPDRFAAKRYAGVGLRYAVDDQLGVDVEAEVLLRGRRPRTELRGSESPMGRCICSSKTSFRSPLASCSLEPAVMA